MSAADWKPYDVPGLAGLLAEQPTDAGTHAMAWQQAYETLTDQRERIEAARAALTQAWPATPGSAAGSFFDQVDALIQAMSATAESAVNAHGALTGIVTAVDGATTKVDTLHQSWQQNQATIADVVPTDDWTQPLNDQAHTVMGQADAAIAEHATQLAPPVAYKPLVFVERYSPLTGANGQLQKRAPAMPNIGANQTATSATLERQTGGSTTRTSGSPAVLTGEALGIGTPQVHSANAGASTVDSVADSDQLPSSGPSIKTAAATSAVTSIRSNTDTDANLAARSVHVQSRGDSTRGHTSLRTGGASELDGGTIAERSRAGSNGFIGASTQRTQNGIVGRTRPAAGTVTTDGSGPELSPSNDRTTGSGPFGTSDEFMPIGGVLSSGGQASGSQQIDRRMRTTKTDGVLWAMPTGVPAVLEAVEDVTVHHDPGTGVIGIDL